MSNPITDAFTKGIKEIENRLSKKYSEVDLAKDGIYRVENYMSDGNPVAVYHLETRDTGDVDMSPIYVFLLTMEIGMGFSMKLRYMKPSTDIFSFYEMLDTDLPKLLNEVESELAVLDGQLKSMSESQAKLGINKGQKQPTGLVNPATGMPFSMQPK